MCDEAEHRSLNLFKDDGTPLQNLAAVVYSFVIFPEDERSRTQALYLINSEGVAYNEASEAYKPSALSKAVMNWAVNRTGQRYAAGLTMLAFQIHFQEGDESVSLYRAAQTVANAIRHAEKIENRPLKIVEFFEGEPTIKGVKVPTGRRDIEKAYREYESVAHLLGADLLSTNSLEIMPLFERTFFTDAVLLNTAALIEKVMFSREPGQFRNPWLVSPALTQEVISMGEVPFEGDFIDFLKAGLKKR